MGTYLSSPIIEKGTEQGECLDDAITPVVWGVVDMQGWRKSMEDTHVAQTNVELSRGSTHAKVFGVFDGHGGPEVARFCQLYLINVLTHTWKVEEGEESGEYSNKDANSRVVGKALTRAFHTLDRMIAATERR
jgi:serine/threonine protein phosphatase PrpC